MENEHAFPLSACGVLSGLLPSWCKRATAAFG